MNETQGAFRSARSLITSLLLSAILVVPFIILEWVNRGVFQEDFPVVLFALMALHSLLIVFLMTPALRHLCLVGSPRSLKPGHWVGLVLGVFLIYVYASVVIDQLPCFFGVPNCD